MVLHNDKHILWRDEARTVFVLDGPQSILDAQGDELAQGNLLLSSTPARTEPYPSQEPKSSAARQRLLQANGDQDIHTIYADLIDQSLQVLATAEVAQWLLPRAIPADTATREPASYAHTVKVEETANMTLGTFVESNKDQLMVLKSTNEPAVSYFVPPRATFVLADCTSTEHISTFHSELRRQAAEADTPWKFDLMVLDPPWDNRSVKRKRGAYSTTSKHGIDDMLARMDLDRLMSVGCVVAVWITNKASARESILGDGGFFDMSGVDLVEEWLWVKVTDHGEPLSNVKGLWRKPYEVLLVGKRRLLGAPRPPVSVRRRTIFSVPDLHSRKPCLKRLFELELLQTANYRALEVFARHLVAGWWSWGNECIKFNAIAHWHRASIQLDHFDQEQPEPAQS